MIRTCTIVFLRSPKQQFPAHLKTISLSATLLFALVANAEAQEFPEPSNRRHTIDLVSGSALGSSRIVGMGGTAIAIAEGSSGMLANPASAGVRPTTSNDTWDWDWHLDSTTADLGSDYDNNGIESRSSGLDPSFTVGLVIHYKDWGIGVTALTQSAVERISEGDITTEVKSETNQGRFALAHWMLDGQLVLAGGVRTILLDVERTTVDAQNSLANSTNSLLSLGGSQIEAGAIWLPKRYNLRAGLSLSPAAISDTATESCDPLNCFGYILPEKVKAPWTVGAGIAYRRSNTQWNQHVTTRWRDERYLVLTADIVVTGKTKRGVGLEAFSQHQLQPSGRKHSVSLRGGTEYEWLPGKLRVRGGSYWEAGRFEDVAGDDVPGRLHVTLGADVRVWTFGFWGNPYRIKISFAADLAKRFANSGLSLGLWH